MNRYTFLKLILIISIISLFFTEAKSGIEIFNNRVILNENNSVNVSDDKLTIMTSGTPTTWDFRNASAKGKVSLKFDKGNMNWTSYPSEPVNVVEVPVNISGFKYNYTTNQAIPFNYQKTLSVAVSNTGQILREISSFSIDGAHEITVVAAIGNITGPNILNFLALEVEVEVERYYTLNEIFTPTISANVNISGTEIKFYWNTISGAESYQLEYTHVNNYNQSNGYGWTQPYAFKYNSTRVTISENSYTIPNIYEKGHLIFRLRAVGKKYSTAQTEFFDVYTKWSVNDNSIAGYVNSFFTNNVHMKLISEPDGDNFNKQAVVTFAEEGKNNYMVDYYDGTLRNRQNLVKINSNDIVLVGETKYDYVGRSALEIMPSPKDNSQLVYNPLFNPLSANQEYTKQYYDLESTLTPERLSTSSGTSKYYSSANPDMSNENQYLPDSEGYPMIRNIYTEDNTGRTKVMGGVGNIFQPGRDEDRTTQFLYSAPFQEELDRLFGSEVGYYKYYKKDMVIDPNGQASVTYSDMKGNVIATALTGEVPSNLKPVNPDPAANELKINILNGADNNVDLYSNSITLRKPFLSDRPQTINVEYALSAEDFHYINECGNFCFNCVYDLIIRITDSRGNPVRIVNTSSNLNVNDIVNENIYNSVINNNYDISGSGCSNYDTHTSYSWTENGLGKAELEAGEYIIEKILVLNTEVLDHYTDLYLSLQQCLPDFETYLQEFLDTIDFSGCYETCEQCMESISNLDPEIYSQEDSQKLLNMCRQLCDTTTNPKCESAYEAMLWDMSPDGQYGLIRPVPHMDGDVPTYPDNPEVNPSQFPLSVFNENNLLPYNQNGSRSWRNPISGNYLNENNEISLVEIVNMGGNVYNPEINAGAEIISIDGRTYVRPHQLRYVQDFLTNWQRSWARSLIEYHPEYLHYKACSSLQNSHDFDFFIISLDQMINWGNIYPFTINDFIFGPESFDPLFTDVSWPFTITQSAVRQQLGQMLENYATIPGSTNTITIWEASYIIYRCGSFDCGCDYSGIGHSIVDDEHWNVFKMLYYSLKGKLLDFVTTQEAINNCYYNGCFSANYAWGVEYGFFSNPAAFNDCQPCNFFRAHLYADKIPRFPTQYYGLGQFGEDQTAAQCYSDSEWALLVSCPEAITAQIQEMENYTDLYLYEQCGQCPVERDLQILFVGLLQRDMFLRADNVNLNCDVPEYTPDLHLEITTNNDEDVFLNSSLINRHEVILKLDQRGDNFCNMVLLMNQSLNNTDISLYSFEDIRGLCCLYDYEGSFLITNYSEYNDRNDFTIDASVVIRPDDPDYDPTLPNKTKKITIYGAISCKEFNGCDFDYICKPNETGNELLSGLRQYLNTNEPIVITDYRYEELFPNLVSEIERCSNSFRLGWIFSFEVQSNIFNIIFKPSPSGIVDPIIISFDISDISNANFLEFVRLRPYSEDPSRISIVVKYELNGQISTREIISNPTCINIGSCDEDIVPQQYTNYICEVGSYENVYYHIEAINTMISNPDNWECADGYFGSQCHISEYYNGCYYDIVASFYGCNTLEFMDSYVLENISSFIVNNDGSIDMIGKLIYANGDTVVCKEKSLYIRINCNHCIPVTYTCNEQETNILKNDLNDYLEAGGTIMNFVGIDFDNGEGCKVNFYIPEGQYIGLNNYSQNTAYPQLDQIIYIEEILSYNRHAIGSLVDNRVDFEIYARIYTGEIYLFYASSDCFVPDCYCKKDVNIYNGDFSLLGNYLQLEDIGFWSHMQNSQYATVNYFESDISHNFPNITVENNGNPFLIYDFTPVVSGDFVLWASDIELEPYTEYDFSCELYYSGTQRVKIDLRELNPNPEESYISLFNERAGYLYEYDVPETVLRLYEPNINGVFIDFTEQIGGNGLKKIILRGTFNSRNKDHMELGIILNATRGQRYYLSMDNVKLKKQEECKCEMEVFPEVTVDPEITCEEYLIRVATFNAQENYNRLLEDYGQLFRDAYSQHCLTYFKEIFNMTLSTLEDQYTLYYYDQSGSLIRTVPPQGVVTVDLEAGNNQFVIDLDRINGTKLFNTQHTMSTVYKYNSLGQLTANFMPDHEQLQETSSDPDLENYSILYYYDKLGRIVATQNSTQQFANVLRYTYRLYDNLDRLIETGEIRITGGISSYMDPNNMYVNYDAFYQFVYNANTKSDVTRTYYDYKSPVEIPGFEQNNLRNRISYTGKSANNFATFFSYDIHGNVKTIMHELKELHELGHGYKRIDYEYDLISGNVNKISYQKDSIDQFYHIYEYDKDNRIKNVLTSKDNVNWTQDAKYFYYKHGPLARVEIGNDKNQAIDYAYTLQGWLKGTNSDLITPGKDMGKDGLVANNNFNRYICKDMFGFSLGYYHKDYSQINTNTENFIAYADPSSGLMEARYNLYNGNISHMVSSIRNINDNNNRITLGFAYQYDQLNRIRSMAAYQNIIEQTNSWDIGGIQTYSSTYSYDKNGNFLNLKRDNRDAVMFDDLAYSYYENSNKLQFVNDIAPSGIETGDIQGSIGDITYDKIGNFSGTNVSSGTGTPTPPDIGATWTISGKIKQVAARLRDINITYRYDALDNLIVKFINPRGAGATQENYYYIRDFQGNIMAVYLKVQTYYSSLSWNTKDFYLLEQPLYGSSRIGNFEDTLLLVHQQYLEISPPTLSVDYHAEMPEIKEQNLGYKNYELTNHLGNVLSIVTDKRTPIISNNLVTSFNADLLITKQYYPFGMEMSGVSSNAFRYRFGFQGQEKDNDITGVEGVNYNFTFRMYDSRIGRFFSIDPLASDYSYNSPYAFAENNVISGIDLEGLEYYFSANGVFLAHNNISNEIRVVTNNEVIIKNARNLLSKDYDKSEILASLQENSKPLSYFNFQAFAERGYHTLKGNPDNTQLARGILKYSWKLAYGSFDLNDVKLLNMGNNPLAIQGDVLYLGIQERRKNNKRTEIGSFPEILSDMGNLINANIHEGTHRQNLGKYVRFNRKLQKFENVVKGGNIIDELEAYWAQINHSSWENTTEDFRKIIYERIGAHLNTETGKSYKEKFEEKTGEKF